MCSTTPGILAVALLSQSALCLDSFYEKRSVVRLDCLPWHENCHLSLEMEIELAMLACMLAMTLRLEAFPEGGLGHVGPEAANTWAQTRREGASERPPTMDGAVRRTGSCPWLSLGARLFSSHFRPISPKAPMDLPACEVLTITKVLKPEPAPVSSSRQSSRAGRVR